MAAFLCPHPMCHNTCTSLSLHRAFLASAYDATQHPSLPLMLRPSLCVTDVPGDLKSDVPR